MTRPSKSSASPPPPPVIRAGQGGLISTPHANDVLCGRGGRINSHEGNIQFRDIVQAMKPMYLDPATKKVEKAVIAADVVARIRAMDPPGRFLKESEEAGMWIDIGDEKARKKAGQALREDAPDIRAELSHGVRSAFAQQQQQQQDAAGQQRLQLPGSPGGTQMGVGNFDYSTRGQYSPTPGMGGMGGGYPPDGGGYGIPPQPIGGGYAEMKVNLNTGMGYGTNVNAMQQQQHGGMAPPPSPYSPSHQGGRFYPSGAGGTPSSASSPYYEQQQQAQAAYVQQNNQGFGNSAVVSPVPQNSMSMNAAAQMQNDCGSPYYSQQQQQQSPSRAQLIRGHTAPSQLGPIATSPQDSMPPPQSRSPRHPGRQVAVDKSAATLGRRSSAPTAHASVPPGRVASGEASAAAGEPSPAAGSTSSSSGGGSHSRKGIMNKFFSRHDQQQHLMDRSVAAQSSVSSSLFSSNTSSASALSYLSGMSIGSSGTQHDFGLTSPRVHPELVEQKSGSDSGSPRTSRNDSGDATVVTAVSADGDKEQPSATGAPSPSARRAPHPHKSKAERGSGSSSEDAGSGPTMKRLSPISSVADPDETRSISSSTCAAAAAAGAGANPGTMDATASGTTNLTVSMSNFDSLYSNMKRSNSFPNLGSVSDIDMLSVTDSFWEESKSNRGGGGVESMVDGTASVTSSMRGRQHGVGTPRGGVGGRRQPVLYSRGDPLLASSGNMGISFNEETEFLGEHPHRHVRPEPGSYASAIRANRLSQNISSSATSAMSGISNLAGSIASDDGDGSSSGKSHQSSNWLKPFKNMQTIGSEQFNPWATESNRSILSDISADLMALDLHTDLPTARGSGGPYHHS